MCTPFECDIDRVPTWLEDVFRISSSISLTDIVCTQFVTDISPDRRGNSDIIPPVLSLQEHTHLRGLVSRLSKCRPFS